MKKQAIISTIVLGIAILVAAGIVYREPISSYLKDAAINRFEPGKISSTRKFKLPADGFYRITQAAEVLPKIIEANINPPDVHVGDIQTLSIVVQGPDPIASVEAHMNLDHGVKILPLELKGEVATRDLVPNPYYIDNGVLAVRDVGPGKNSRFINSASAAEGAKLRYEASWKVQDTHDTSYRTTFIVKDTKGRENSITISWSDACSIPITGAWSLSTTYGGNCTISSDDGVEAGNVTIATYTLTLNSAFAWNPGYSVIVSSGAIAIGSGGSLAESYVWGVDSDSDSYTGSGLTVSLTDPGVAWNRRGTYTSYDCYDSNVDAHPGQTLFFASDRGDGSFDYNCDSSEEQYDSNIANCGAQSQAACSAGAGGGWETSVPACGGSGIMDTCHWFNGSCSAASLGANQTCR